MKFTEIMTLSGRGVGFDVEHDLVLIEAAGYGDGSPSGDLCDELNDLPTLRRGQQFPLVAVEEGSTDCRIIEIALLDSCEEICT